MLNIIGIYVILSMEQIIELTGLCYNGVVESSEINQEIKMNLNNVGAGDG